MSSSETEDTLVALRLGKCISPPATLLFSFYLPVRLERALSTQMLVGERVMPENLLQREIVAGRRPHLLKPGLTWAF